MQWQPGGPERQQDKKITELEDTGVESLHSTEEQIKAHRKFTPKLTTTQHQKQKYTMTPVLILRLGIALVAYLLVPFSDKVTLLNPC